MKTRILIAATFTILCATSKFSLPADYLPPSASAAQVARINFHAAIPVDESYRAQFDRCDREDIFNGVSMKGFRKCSTDPNRARALLKFPNGTVFFESKLGLDIDGSWKACNNPGTVDLCPTWMRWENLPAPKKYIDSDLFPYVVIPIAGLNGHDDPEFRNKTGIKQGDLGVVIYKDKVVPVFIADGGPHNKLGEGSAALFKALGQDRCRQWRSDGHCQSYRDFSIERGVLTFVFPNSRIADLTPENAREKVGLEAMRRFERLKQP